VEGLQGLDYEKEKKKEKTNDTERGDCRTEFLILVLDRKGYGISFFILTSRFALFLNCIQIHV
jgi:hypothetical protein